MEKKLFFFPKPSKKLGDNDFDFQISHVKEELGEFEDEINADQMELAAEELIDLFHTVEWLMRMFIKKTGIDLYPILEKVLEKNKARGYYS